MVFVETRLEGVVLIEPDVFEDERGYFACTFNGHEMKAHGLDATIVQTAISYNRTKGTLRGMHYQIAPHEQAKLVRCTRGAVYDVVVDLRDHSPTLRRWLAVELSAQGRSMLYVPKGFAHGFLTLEDATEVSYSLSDAHAPECERGLRWDDPALGIVWPIAPAVMSKRDKAFVYWEGGPSR